MDKVTSSIVVLGIVCVVNFNSLVILTWQSKYDIGQLRSTVDQLLLTNERYSVQIRTLETMAGLWSSDDDAPKLNSGYHKIYSITIIPISYTAIAR